jgi:Fe-Mn family superoxide dismutase
MAYKPKDYKGLLGTKGFSDKLLANHFKLYEGYVINVNKLMELLRMEEITEPASPQYAELKRRFGWEFNGMRLHELYFGNMVKDGTQLGTATALSKKLIEDFGSLNNWEADFRSTGIMRGIGWVILAYDSEGKKLFNLWINEHDVGHLAGAVPILVMDVFEHAFMIDYGLARKDYIDAFMAAIDWKSVAKRFDEAK